VASANPEDYTNRGRIITPLKDRYGAQIRTHYPKSIEDEITIVDQEYTRFDDMVGRVTTPGFMKEIVAEITRLARNSPEISQRSGVSLRMSISNYETLLGSALKRAIRHREPASPRITDLPSIAASTTGKIELETVEEGREGKLIASLIDRAVLSIFGKYFTVGEFDDVLSGFDEGMMIDAGPDVPSFVYVEQLKHAPALSELVNRVSGTGKPAEIASAVELVLEGLHLNRKLNRDAVGHKVQYRG
jgi:magnesium chelatase subunit I